MNIVRGWKLRKALRRRKLISGLRQANQQLRAAYEGLAANQAYHPSCLGGVEDKYDGQLQWESRLYYWKSEVNRLTRKLRMTREQAAKYK